MNLDPILTNLVICGIFFFNIALFYLPNTEWIGFGFFFIWNLFTNTFLFRQGSEEVLLIIGSLLLISLFLIILTIVKLHSYYLKKTGPIKLFPEKRKALDTYKIIYTVSQIVLLLLLGWSQINGKKFIDQSDKYILGFGTVLFLSIWIGTWINEHRKETDLYPFECAIGSSLGVVFLIGIYSKMGFEKISKLLLLQGELAMSSYLIFLSNWIHKTSLHQIN